MKTAKMEVRELEAKLREYKFKLFQQHQQIELLLDVLAAERKTERDSERLP